MRTVFALFDKDNSGSISADELRAAFEQLGQTVSDEELTKMITEADADGFYYFNLF
jgi:calmodulin